MYWDIITAEYLDGYRIKVCFRDGKSGVVDMASYIAKGGVFQEIADIDVFRKFMIDPDWHVLSWQGGRIDIAPETVYASVTGTIPLQRVAEGHSSYG